jgi:hypothetical protein
MIELTDGILNSVDENFNNFAIGEKQNPANDNNIDLTVSIPASDSLKQLYSNRNVDLCN